jgi:hypothetical protein
LEFSSEEEIESLTVRSGTMSASSSGGGTFKKKKDPLAVLEKSMKSKLMTQKIKQNLLL